MKCVALTKVMRLGFVSIAVGLLTGAVVSSFIETLSAAELAKICASGAVVAGLFLLVMETRSGRHCRRVEPCTGCGMELNGLGGNTCSRCGMARSTGQEVAQASAAAAACRTCGYDLTGLTVQACPECGTYFAGPGTLQTLLSRNLGLSGWCVCCGEAIKLPPGEPCPRCHSRYRSATKPLNT